MAVNNTFRKMLACPICYNGLKWTQNAGLYNFQCSICKKAYSKEETHVDLTITSGGNNFGECMPASTELFRIPFISYLYERGWRQCFSYGGFPGPEKEFELIKDYLQPVLGGNILDASCGSGLFSRLFAKSGLFSAVVALDYSQSMLQQCSKFMEQDENFPQQDLMMVRADISRLPFSSSSLDAVHAGAALHCWPSPSAAVAEISRVLRPGGVFVASTFLFDGRYSHVPFSRTIRQNIKRVLGHLVFLSETELQDLCRSCGLVDFKCVRNGRFVMIYAMKPS